MQKGEKGDETEHKIRSILRTRPKNSKQGLSVHGERKIHYAGDTPLTPNSFERNQDY